jgi:hypothetical protein
VAFAAGGIAAFVVAGSEQTNGQRQCMTIVSNAAGACDSERNAVRAWDYTAAGAWIAAAALGAVSIVLWSSHAREGPSALLVGPGQLAVKGAF